MRRERIEIALVYIKLPGWMGGTYYVQNIISALNILEDEEQPLLNIYCLNESDFSELSSNTGYKYLIYHHFGIKETKRDLVNKVFNYYYYKASHQLEISDRNVFIYPLINPSRLRNVEKMLAWIPDFQCNYLPSYFSFKVKLSYYRMIRKYYKNHVPVVLSSFDALNDYKKFYPKANNKTYVLHFAVTHPDYSKQNIEDIKIKYGIAKPYLFCANQFWKHKNHLFLFRVIKRLIDSGKDIQLICSGALKEPRNPEYILEIKKFIKINKLEDRIKLLGFIDRAEQICLMKHSWAMIQPSLFEGWSSVVEDAKALNKFIFLTDLKVNIEQSPLNVCYFNGHDEDDLLKKLQTIEPTSLDEHYISHIKRFAEDFMSIVYDFSKESNIYSSIKH